jgi:hypothetical protein
MGKLEGVPTSQRDPRLNHLFFANNSLLFCISDLGLWQKLSSILNMYEMALGQRLNSSKTSIYFSCNTHSEARQQILDASGVPSSQRFETYLGMLALMGKSHIKEFKGIVDKVWKCFQD